MGNVSRRMKHTLHTAVYLFVQREHKKEDVSVVVIAVIGKLQRKCTMCISVRNDGKHCDSYCNRSGCRMERANEKVPCDLSEVKVGR